MSTANSTDPGTSASIVLGVRFEWMQDDLRALVSGRPVLAEGWGLRPDLVAPLLDSPDRMIVLVPTPEFRRHQLRVLPRANTFAHAVRDPARAQHNRLERDRLVAEDAIRTARRHDVPVVEVDGTRDAEAMADLVAAHIPPRDH